MLQRKAVIVGVVGIIVLVLIGIYVYTAFFYTKQCSDLSCFKESFSSCSRAQYINEADEASWRYQIIGKSSDMCLVDVTLLQAKKGDLALDKLGGLSMRCTVSYGRFEFPEKDLDSCTGRLREELQSLLIAKIYKYIIPNFGQINKDLNSLSSF